MAIIEVRNLKKYYGQTKAVDDISFHVNQGEIFGMLGPNGAGKTTTVEIIEGLRRPDSGQVTVLGIDVIAAPDKVHDLVGIQLQTTALYPRLTVREVIELFRTFFDGSTHDATSLITLMNLGEKQNTRTKELSGGQKQRLSVALALVNKPQLVFLDEPTTGLDPQARRSLWSVIQDIRQQGATVCLTTHYMEEAETLCDRVAVLDAGKIIALASPDELIRNNFAETAIVFDLKTELPPMATFETLAGVSRAVHENGSVTVYTSDTTASLGGLTRLDEMGVIKLDDLHMRQATLEDVFLKLTGKQLRE